MTRKFSSWSIISIKTAKIVFSQNKRIKLIFFSPHFVSRNNLNSMAKFDANSWEFTQKVVRIGHNRRIQQYFKDIKSDKDTNTGRAALKTALLIRDEDSALEVQVKMTYFTGYLNGDYVISYPEGWEMKKGTQIPQLAIIFRDTNKNSISGNYTLHIPHYNGKKKPTLPIYEKGDHWARWILKDNSQILVNARTEAEVIRVIGILEKQVESKFRTEKIPWMKLGRYTRGTIKQIKVAPIRADYYPNGKENSFPKWRHYP